jgi:hypothetical protein
MSGIPQIVKCLQGSVREGDNIVFSSGQDKTQLGEVIHSDEDGVLVKIFLVMDSETLKRFSIIPINPNNFPLSYYDGLVEVYKSPDEMYVKRCNILDLALIVLIAEVESGMFHMSGAEMCIAPDFPWWIV